MQIWNTPIQLPAAVADPEVRILFCRGTFLTNLTMAMAALAASDAPHPHRSQLILWPYCFRRTRLDQSKTFVVPRFVFLRHPLDLAVEHIDSLRRLSPSSRGAPLPPLSRRTLLPVIMDPLERNNYLTLNKY